MELIIEKLKGFQHRSSTSKMYLNVWRQFNSFLLRLDERPNDWEDRVSLFIAYIIDVKKLQSSTIKSYISAIKTTLKVDGYPWDDRKVLTNTFTKACRQVNDRAFIRLPIHCGLLEVLLFEIKRKFASQPYLESLYWHFLLLDTMAYSELEKSR